MIPGAVAPPLFALVDVGTIVGPDCALFAQCPEAERAWLSDLDSCG